MSTKTNVKPFASFVSGLNAKQKAEILAMLSESVPAAKKQVARAAKSAKSLVEKIDKVLKQGTPRKPTAVPVKAAVARIKRMENGEIGTDLGDDIRRSDAENRVRLYEKDFDARGFCVVNGRRYQQSVSDGKGRFSASMVGAVSGDSVALVRTRRGVIEAHLVPAVGFKPKAVKKAASVPAGKAKVAAPKKTARKVAVRPPSKGASLSSPVRTKAALTVRPAKVAKKAAAVPQMTFPERMAAAKAAKAAAAVPVVPVVPAKAKKTVAPKMPAKPQPGTSPLWKSQLAQFKQMVAENRKAGRDRLAIVPNCPYLETDGRRYLKGGKAEISQIKAFNRAATAAGFYGTDGLSQAGQLLLK